MRFEDEFGEDDLPVVGSEAGLVLGVGAVAVPGGDGEDGGVGAAHVRGRLVAGGEGADLGAVAVKESPAVRVLAYMEAVGSG